MAINRIRLVVTLVVAAAWAVVTNTELVPSFIAVDVCIYVLCSVIVMMSVPAPWVVPRYGKQSLLRREREQDLLRGEETIDQFQIIGTHNSTHQCNLFSALFIKMWKYSHGDIQTQLDLGLRSLEVDMWYNISSGIWELKHEILVDDLTTTGDHCLRTALKEIRRWSLANEGHFPLAINLDIKGAYWPLTGWLAPFIGRGFHPGSRYELKAYENLKKMIVEIWGTSCIFTPRSLPLRSDKQLWPTASSLAGQSMFLLNTYGGKSCEKADHLFFFCRGHNVSMDTTQMYYENDMAAALSKGLLTRSLCESQPATFMAIDDLRKLKTSITVCS
eukprot:TRINITY_DN24563_c0_g1_i1.p1 TRINITY_DN24563_c0_g1~~TRINITY_DN24563_c0_g1_i1.p1  ORF type:complete len:331 (+),score=49.61 TRINITY_DN24563_c0_g1_i1:44-1036(+)